MVEFVWPVVDWSRRFRRCSFSYYFEGTSQILGDHFKEHATSATSNIKTCSAFAVTRCRAAHQLAVLEMAHKPVSRWCRSLLEIFHVGIEVTTRKYH